MRACLKLEDDDGEKMKTRLGDRQLSVASHSGLNKTEPKML